MSKPVCCKEDVQATPSTKVIEGSTGTWSAGDIQYKTYDHLTVGGKQVAYEASCTFSYDGQTTSSPSTKVTGSEDVKLSAGATVLEHGSSKVLLDGDTKSGDTYQNKLQVQSSQILKSD
jgi:hypothetical protein